MKKLILILLMATTGLMCQAQDNPYKAFGYKLKTDYKDNPLDIYEIKNADSLSGLRYLIFTRENKTIKLLDKKDSVIRIIRYTDEDILRWTAVDPLAAKYPSLSPYNYVMNNPIRLVDPTGMEIDLPGDKKAQDAYLKMLHDHTGNNYEIKDNKLLMTGVDKDFKGKASTTLADIISKGIGSKDVYSLQLVGANGDDKGVFVDSYEQGKIDVSDLAKVGQTSSDLQGALIGHFLNEVQEVPGYNNADASTRDANFNTAHIPSLNVEGKIFGELSGDATITTRQTLQTGPPVNGYQTLTFKYNNANQFNFVQGATSKSVPGVMDFNGVKVPTTNVSIISTGELKSVTKVQ